MSYGYAPQHRQELPIFSAPGVEVTSARFVVQSQTYPMGSISSVSPFLIPSSTAGMFWVLFFAFGVLSCGLFFAISIAASSVGGAVLFGLLAVPNLVAALLINRAIRARKPSYGVMISTAGMNVRAVVHTDQAFVQAIVNALNHALSMR